MIYGTDDALYRCSVKILLQEFLGEFGKNTQNVINFYKVSGYKLAG